MSLFEEWADEDFERPLRRPASYKVMDHGRWFRRLFPKQRYTVFFRQLERITKRKLSFSERDQIIGAGFRLLMEKHYVETAEDFRNQLKEEAEIQKMFYSDFEKINSLADQLLEHIKIFNKTTLLSSRREVQDFRYALYAPLDKDCSNAPIVPVLNRIIEAAKNMIEEHKPRAKPGPAPDTALRVFIAELAQIFGGKVTAGSSRKEGRRTSPFIEFVKATLFKLPENAFTGRDGIYTSAAIEAHVAAVCADLDSYVKQCVTR